MHADLGVLRSSCDCKDCWINEHNLFAVDDGKLRCLISGLTASESDNINCDNVEDIALAIQVKMNDLRFTDVSLKRSEQV